MHLPRTHNNQLLWGRTAGESRNTTTDQGEDETELLDEALNFDGLLLCKYC
jgi:hypothetical protein